MKQLKRRKTFFYFLYRRPPSGEAKGENHTFFFFKREIWHRCSLKDGEFFKAGYPSRLPW